MSRAELVDALKHCVAALEDAPARFRINFEPYWQWQQQAQQPALAQAKAALDAEQAVTKK